MSSPPVFNFYDRVHQKLFESSNDRGYFLIPSDACTPAANRLYYFDNIIKGQVRRKTIFLRINQGKVMRVFYSDYQRTLLKTYMKRWDNLYTTQQTLFGPILSIT